MGRASAASSNPLSRSPAAPPDAPPTSSYRAGIGGLSSQTGSAVIGLFRESLEGLVVALEKGPSACSPGLEAHIQRPDRELAVFRNLKADTLPISGAQEILSFRIENNGEAFVGLFDFQNDHLRLQAHNRIMTRSGRLRPPYPSN